MSRQARPPRFRPLAAEHIRRRVNGLPADARRRIDEAVADLCDRAVEGIHLTNLDCRLYQTFHGDEILYDLNERDRLLILIDIKIVER